MVMLLAIIITFIIFRLYFFYIGIFFDASPLSWYWQFIDPYLLKNHLIQSCYYLHIQPPLFNCFLGIVLKMFPNHEVYAFALIYCFQGLMLAVSIYLIMIRLGISRKLSFTFTLLFSISPSSILYENWLFYDYSLAVLLCLSALSLSKFIIGMKLRDGLYFFGTLSMIVMIRSLFHILWFIFFLGILVYVNRQNWKKIVFAAFVPFILIFLLYMKNLCVFGSFNSSSWLGMSLARMTTAQISENERKLFAKEGKISSISMIQPFSDLEQYQGDLISFENTGIPVLDQAVKSTGINNFNNLAYIDISKQYLKDAVFVLTAHPGTYLKTVLNSIRTYVRPSSDYFLFNSHNRQTLHKFETIYNRVVYGKWLNNDVLSLRNASFIRRLLNKPIFLITAFVIGIVYGFFLILQSLLKVAGDRPFLITVFFMWINIIYVTIVGNCLEYGENNRFRFMIDPFLFILMGLFLDHVFKSLLTAGTDLKKRVRESRIYSVRIKKSSLSKFRKGKYAMGKKVTLLTRRQFLVSVIGLWICGSILWLFPYFSRSPRLNRLLYRLSSIGGLPGGEKGLLKPETLLTLESAVTTLLQLDIELVYYQNYFKWRAENLEGYKVIYQEFENFLNQAAKKFSKPSFVKCDSDLQRSIIDLILPKNSLERIRNFFLHDERIIYEKFVLREIFRLFTCTDAWIFLGYEAWPGIARGLDSYSSAPVSKNGK